MSCLEKSFFSDPGKDMDYMADTWVTFGGNLFTRRQEGERSLDYWYQITTLVLAEWFHMCKREFSVLFIGMLFEVSRQIS